MSEKPDYTPQHRLPVWLSSEDVLAAIGKVATSDARKAVCWDMRDEVLKLIAKERGDA